MSAQEDVVRYSRQLGWFGLAAIAVGAVAALAGAGGFGAVLALVGVATFVVTRYLLGRYEVSEGPPRRPGGG